jgi:hypothetical protein
MKYLIPSAFFFAGLALGILISKWHGTAPIENDDPHDVRKP